MNLQPTACHIILQTMEAKEKESAIILPGTVQKETSNTAKVVAVGPGVFDKAISVDDVVVFRKYVPEEVIIEDEKFLILQLSDVMAVIK